KEKLRELLFGEDDAHFMPFGGRGRGRGKRFGRHHARRGFAMPTPPTPPAPPEAYADAPHFRRGRGRGRGFGGRWEARWGYDLGPWWDADDSGAGEEKPKNSES